MLLDCGNGEKLEKIDDFILRRPAPQAVAKRKLPTSLWNKFSARFSQHTNEWIINSSQTLPHFSFNDINMELKLSNHGQIGVFPEQLPNWDWLIKIINENNRPLNILNGFAYTGAATLAAAAASHTVTHLDAAASSVKWAKQNASLSAKSKLPIRWIVDDINAFVKREQKRNAKYDGIILDPPAFGRSKKGGIWKIEKHLPQLLKNISSLLSDDPEFVVLSCHDKNFSKDNLRDLLTQMGLTSDKLETFDMIIRSDDGNNLDAGKCARYKKMP